MNLMRRRIFIFMFMNLYLYSAKTVAMKLMYLSGAMNEIKSVTLHPTQINGRLNILRAILRRTFGPSTGNSKQKKW